MRARAFFIGAGLHCLSLSVVTADVAGAIGTRDTMELPTARAEQQRMEQGPASVNRIEGEGLQRFASLEDAVNALPGFHVREEGGLGGYSELSFRGSDAAAVEIYLDGLRLNQEGGPTPDLAKWPLLWFSSVEARSGFNDFGSGDPGSLARIDLSTQSLQSKSVEVRGRVGSFSTAEGAVNVHVGTHWKWTMGLEGQTARNDYPFFTDNGTIYVTSDDAWLRMENNTYWSRGARASLQHEGASLKQTLSLLWLDYNKEYPGLPNTVSNPQAYTRRGEWMGAWRIEAYPGRSIVEAGVQAHHFDDAFHDPGKSLGYASYEEARAATSVEADARFKMPLPNKFDVSAEGRLADETVEPTATPYDQVAASPAEMREEAQLGTTVQKTFFDALSLTAEARAAGIYFRAKDAQDFFADTPHVVSHPQVPFALRTGTKLQTSFGNLEALGRYEERSPSSEEFLGDNHGIRANLNLSPQKTWTASFLHEWRRKIFWMQTTAFWHRYEYPIRLEPYGASPFLHYDNGPAYRAVGIEGDDRIDMRKFAARFSWTLQNLRILEGTAANKWPAYQSPVEGHFETFWKPKLWGTDVVAGPSLDILGEYFPGDANIADTKRSAELEPGAHLSAQRQHVNLAFDARNLLDRNYRDFAYSIRSGRNYSLSLSIVL